MATPEMPPEVRSARVSGISPTVANARRIDPIDGLLLTDSGHQVVEAHLRLETPRVARLGDVGVAMPDTAGAISS
jgi:hypothetical protein